MSGWSSTLTRQIWRPLAASSAYANPFWSEKWARPSPIEIDARTPPCAVNVQMTQPRFGSSAYTVPF
jgi:hypothetical protein